MKSLLCTLFAITALSVGGLFTTSAVAAGGGYGGHYGGHGHKSGHGHNIHGNQNHGGQHNHGGNYPTYSGGYGYGGYPNQYQQNGVYLRGSNFGVRIGF
ncbi:hypothetical protein ETAA8_17980 [Anatilimnocola aggregata]|uniref:Uncharacterized protein n=1 Tax=Anatilimnocola aggregata TaxID=2528021 RepID=A0A517Y8Z9_9BACT|nr:sulfur globule protein precursor [Anatilimnocola aggregata]QDU26717.1 hypothetical protein ETAA8_17980 [Anatilimnocola aggregata]